VGCLFSTPASGLIYPMTSPLDSVVVALERESIIPDVIPSNFTPTLLFSIVYPTGYEVATGNTLLRENTLDEPDVVISPMNLPFANANSTGEGDDLTKEVSYTLVMTDPDAPSRGDPKHGQVRHWVISGIKSAPQGSTNETQDLASLKTKSAITPYRPPTPGPGSGVHRYVFLLFEEPVGGYDVPAGAREYGAEREQRINWNAIAFGEKYGLKLVGADFFLLKAADPVPLAV